MASVRPGKGVGVDPRGLPRAGLWVLVPGAAQWSWGQRERGLVFFGSFTAGLATAAFAWGTPVGLTLLGFAFVTHVASTVDLIRQSAFPGPGRVASVVGPAGGLGLGLYAPVLAAASLVAWPGLREGSEDGYLVNCWAYRRAEPKRNELVWYRSKPGGAPRVGRVVAGRGQEVEWSGGELRIDGRPDQDHGPVETLVGPQSLTYRVPEGHVLIRPEGRGDAARPPADGLTIVGRDQIIGRPWVRFYPLRDRRLL